MTTTTTGTRPPVGDAARVASERTAWQYVTAMHAAAVGGPRAPVRGIVEDVEDMRVQLTRERDVARARVAALEKQLAGLAANAAPARAKTPVHPGKAPANPVKTRITLPELLMNEGMVTLDQCLEVMRYQKRNGGRFSTAFVKLGLLTEKQVIAVLARVYGIPSIDLERVQANPALTEILPAGTARKYRVLPLATTTTLTVAVADPGDWLALEAVASLTGCHVQPVLASDAALERATDRAYGPQEAAPPRERGLRIAWSRRDELPANRTAGPEGDRPAA